MVDAQLSLFDSTTAEVGSSYQVGDWVKVRRKPAIAAERPALFTYCVTALATPTRG